MMAYSDDHIALAAEYAVGTLDAEERAQVEAMMAVDNDYAALVRGWEFRLGALNQMVGLVEPRAEVWERIKGDIAKPEIARPETSRESATAGIGPETSSDPADRVADVAPEAVADIAPQPEWPVAASETSEAEHSAPVVTIPAPETPTLVHPLRAGVAANDNADLVQLASRVRQWRVVANTMTALAAVLLAMLAIEIARPDLLPDLLRPKPRARLAEAKAPSSPPGQFAALLQGDGASPAFILTVDAGSKTLTARRVGAAAEAGKSYELWLVSDKLQQPRSLGVIGASEFTTGSGLSPFDAETLNQATFAVTLEQEGGSPTGVATGPILYSGKLIETVPSAAPLG
jgi:anti-sigma-K factor RskA